MRIISGKYRGRRLKCPEVARPTTDRAKEGLFSMLSSRVDFSDSSVLDLYCGSGGLGLEALSRGANSCIFVDCSRESVSVVQENLDSLGLDKSEESTVVLNSAMEFLRDEQNAVGLEVDLILADPPYADAEPERLLEQIYSSGILKPGGLVVIEGPLESRFKLPSSSPWQAVVERSYSESLISVFRLS